MAPRSVIYLIEFWIGLCQPSHPIDFGRGGAQSGSLKVLTRVALPMKVIVLAYLFVLFARHNDPNFELAKVLSYPGERLDLGFAGRLAERHDCRLADQHHGCGGFRPLHALADRHVGWHPERLGQQFVIENRPGASTISMKKYALIEGILPVRTGYDPGGPRALPF